MFMLARLTATPVHVGHSGSGKGEGEGGGSLLVEI